jgi:hypothetical protein
MYPLNSNGSVSLCAICGSKMHWAKKCPHAYERSLYLEDDDNMCDEEEVQITLMASSEDSGTDKMDRLLGETIGSVLLDSGCSKTVCGNSWLDCYLDTLTKEELFTVKYVNSASVYRFGDGKRATAIQCVVFPCVLAGRNIKIKADVVDCNIPLLLSKASMKKAGMVIDLNTDTAVVFSRQVKLDITSVGHYTLPIYRPICKARVEEILVSSVNHDDKYAVALKLHRQFAHPASDKIKKLLKDADKYDKELGAQLDKISASCDVCCRYKKPRPRPVVSLYTARNFNDTVGMDLKIWKAGVYFLVMVDHATRYCNAVLITNKNANTIVSAIFKHWIAMFGAPKKFLSDNGREFNNDIMACLGDSFNITLLCTAAESPWSNGICERLNCILNISVQRIIEDVNCDLETALAWAVAARNSLHNYGGYSPNQLVFGYNPALPNVCNDSPASAEPDRSPSEVVANNLKAMQVARIDYIKNESNEKLRRAMVHQIRQSDVEDIGNGDRGVVIGRDSKQILVRHGGSYVRVHSCRLQHEPATVGTLKLKDKAQTNPPCEDKQEVGCNEDSEDDTLESSETIAASPPCNDEATVAPGVSGRKATVKIGATIECWPKDGSDKFSAEVVSRAGKATGAYAHCYNIKRDTGEVEWIDLSKHVDKWCQISENEVLIAENIGDLMQAKEREIENWKQNNVFEESVDNGQETLSVRWVITEKIKDGQTVTKARLVVRGFEEDLQEERTDSPTCCKESESCHGYYFFISLDMPHY